MHHQSLINPGVAPVTYLHRVPVSSFERRVDTIKVAITLKEAVYVYFSHDEIASSVSNIENETL